MIFKRPADAIDQVTNDLIKIIFLDQEKPEIASKEAQSDLQTLFLNRYSENPEEMIRVAFSKSLRHLRKKGWASGKEFPVTFVQGPLITTRGRQVPSQEILDLLSGIAQPEPEPEPDPQPEPEPAPEPEPSGASEIATHYPAWLTVTSASGV